ncbi:hypothetical protein Dtox_4244 [Desulfofarcimen acetoxidans DSM 771]|uniref:Uncharacterized protein n=1 Tax=Desulfofarcimen acetoxidans (strain ATCC 49208 / DSM 771 / KCTC 5769 / VKM B-1644 / 5575) TaxID=485916 RepID=C8VZG6_DESAS|nr:hypothetical protein [Desulfofarcimen acetoxidans]ACV64911.1 hypothetical protein Dtox_4244 [Desulfofarcimen acetoxidans DSM 771]
MAYLLHFMFQRQGLTPGQFWQKPRGEQIFLIESTKLAIEEENRRRKEGQQDG